MMHTFIVTFCFHIEFHRKATVLNCCELKKLKILNGDYYYMHVIMIYVITMLYPMEKSSIMKSAWSDLRTPISTQINICSSHFFSSSFI